MSTTEQSEEFWVRPIFRVADVKTAVDYYLNVLGFRTEWSYGGDEPIVAQVERGGFSVILDRGSEMQRPVATSVVTFSLHAPRQLQALHDEFVERGARVLKPPFEVSWQEGVVQFDVADLDGNVLVFWGEWAERRRAPTRP